MRNLVTVIAIFFAHSGFTYELEQAAANQAHELAECSAYYSVMSGCAENTKPNDPLSDQLMDVARQAFVLSASISNVEVTTARTELAIKQMQEESMNHCSNSSILINKYAETCKVAIEDPESRTNYWLNKSDGGL